MTSSIGKADTVIKNANIITIDTSRPKAQALAMTHGRFAGVGSNEDLEGLIGPGTKVLDLGGKTVLPGFIDAHIHVLSSGIRHVMAADCDVPTLKQVQAGLKEKAGKTPAGQWVQGFKFDDTKTDRTASNEGRHLYRDDLDAVTTAHPILVAHRAGHVYYMNTAALEAAGFNDETPDPPGGRLGRDPDTGRLNGMIFERAIDPVRFGLIPVETEEVRREGLRTICGMLNRAGLTSVHDARVTAEEFQTYQDGKAAGELSLRVYALMWYPQFPALRDAGIKSGLGDDLLRIGGIKMVADGAIATRTAYLSQPYEGSQCDHGILAMEQDEIEEQVMAMHRAGFQVCIHANGDLTIDMVLTAYEKAQKAYPRVNTRHRIEHCTLVNEDLLMRMKALGCIATPFCTYVYHHGEKMRYYGEQRLEWMFAQRSFIDSGVVSTGATDYPPGPFEPLLGIQSCVTRTDSTGKEWGVNQRVSVEEALRLYTLNGAYASFEEDSKGSIETGKLADLVVLGSDPNKVDPLGIKDIAVERTIVGGETVYGG
ncbi:MAG: amidohydrolase [Chloroflexi bacterium]|nr:amidohydrolase [Chloroflexota bacterium]